MSENSFLTAPVGYLVVHPDNLTEDQWREVEKLPGRENINILRDRELALVLVREDGGYPAAGLWTSWHAGRFTFDVVVFSPDRRRGLAKFLVQYAMQQYNEDREAFPSPLFVVHAVNPKMKMLLEEPFGFSVAMPPNGQGTTTWEMIPTTDDDCRVIIPQHELVSA